MRIFVKVIPKAKMAKIEKMNDNHFKVWVTESPEGGKANEAVIRLIADYFNIKESDILLVSGASSRQKVLEIDWHEL